MRNLFTRPKVASELDMSTAFRADRVFSLEQAAGEAPALAMLQQRVSASRNCLRMVQHLIPPSLHKQVAAGPLNDGDWCLLVSSAAASSKMRQLLPAIHEHLVEQGAQVTSVRLKVQTATR